MGYSGQVARSVVVGMRWLGIGWLVTCYCGCVGTVDRRTPDPGAGPIAHLAQLPPVIPPVPAADPARVDVGPDVSSDGHADASDLATEGSVPRDASNDAGPVDGAMTDVGSSAIDGSADSAAVSMDASHDADALSPIDARMDTGMAPMDATPDAAPDADAGSRPPWEIVGGLPVSGGCRRAGPGTDRTLTVRGTALEGRPVGNYRVTFGLRIPDAPAADSPYLGNRSLAAMAVGAPGADGRTGWRAIARLGVQRKDFRQSNVVERFSVDFANVDTVSGGPLSSLELRVTAHEESTVDLCALALDPVFAGSSPDTHAYGTERVGIFYFVWHAVAATQAVTLSASYDYLTVEELVRSGNGLFSEFLAGPNWMVEPKLGFYCGYRRQPFEVGRFVPDCDDPAGAATDIRHVLRSHAATLWGAGVDHVIVDLTNDTWDPVAGAVRDRDALPLFGVSPVRELFREWAWLRSRGVMTPQIVLWVPLGPTDAVVHLQRYLDIYGDPTWQPLIPRDPRTGRLVVYGWSVPAGMESLYDAATLRRLRHTQATVDLLSDNRGREPKLQVVRTWSFVADADYARGFVPFYNPCREQGRITTTVGDATRTGPNARPCAQLLTTNSPTGLHGTALTVNIMSHNPAASVLWMSSGYQHGLPFKKQFETAFSTRPDNLVINGWNQFLAAGVPSDDGYSVYGLEYDRSPITATSPFNGQDTRFVDGYASEFTLDIEPTEDYGYDRLELLRSCLRVYRARGHCDLAAHAGEACCDFARSDEWKFAYSFRNIAVQQGYRTEHYLTAMPEVLQNLRANTGTFKEVCARFTANFGPAARDLCIDPDLTNNNHDGPFMLYRRPGRDRIPLYRCRVAAGSYNFVAETANPCPGTGAPVEELIGYISTVKTSATARAFRRCVAIQAGMPPHYFHWLSNESCPAGSSSEAVFGFVR